ncbi:glycosyltransferase [Pontibacter arcticus]|uniref:Glycosyltransferase family 1 protein n=1 Tax=Pontibacter arcticus TaxID=2080288 RepID=A0A364RD57_9BACT|nr:glycosyltransferase [Pontibacter arcticus]RAU82223.1 glycosyltransferase family 1 protein [Pontibacter arcticus]
MKVLFVVPYPTGKAASQRYRVEQWLPILQKQSIGYKISPFWDNATWAILYTPGHTVHKIIGLLKGFLKRVWLLPQLGKYDSVFIHREAMPLGPPWFEWMVSKVFRKKLIYDFDDAIWLENTTTHNELATKLKWPEKVAAICKWSYKISCGNHYILDFAKTYNDQSLYLPTVVDTQKRYHTLKKQDTEKLVIGWIGSHSTLPYLKLIEPVLQELEQKYSFDFLVIADRAPDIHVKSLEYKVWSEATEITDLLEMNIGVMPLPDTEWTRGKCAFKAIQYMALGIPAVVSAVGANQVAVRSGVTGYTCKSDQDWYNSLEELLNNTALRIKMGRAAQKFIETNFSVAAQQEVFLRLFR